MPHSAPDFRTRAQLEELMDGPCSREEMRACLRDLAWTNRWTMAYRPLLQWIDSQANELSAHADTIRILDVASGYGDGLRKLEQWALARGIAVELTGLDVNADAAIIAAEASQPSSRIRWVTGDVFVYPTPRPYHLIVSSLFTHHLTDDAIVQYLKWVRRNASLGWFISDLSRAAIPYYSFKVLSKLAKLHPFVQHDGPISIARSFVRADWQQLCAAAGLDAEQIVIEKFTPARICVSWKKPMLGRKLQ